MCTYRLIFNPSMCPHANLYLMLDTSSVVQYITADYLPVKPVDSLHVHRDTGTSPCKDGCRLCFSFIITETQTEQLIHVICLEQSSLLRVFQHSISKKLLENLPVKPKIIIVFLSGVQHMFWVLKNTASQRQFHLSSQSMF